MRVDGREPEQLRPVTIELSPVIYPDGSALIRMGNTHVLCVATIQEGVPRWLGNSGRGWLTAEYALLPGATQTRTPRAHINRGRAQEIRRLIGRSLRQAVDLALLGERSLTVDCDVLQADGGTRTAAITGGYVAVALAVHKLIHEGLVPPETLKIPVAAVSIGVVGEEAYLDLSYVEDSTAQIDLNVVMDAEEHFIEVQGTAEGKPTSRPMMDRLLDLAPFGIAALICVQREALACAGITR